MDAERLEQVSEDKPFGPNEEKAIISLAFDIPEFFNQVGRFMNYKFFQKLEHQFVYAIIEKHYNKHNCIPTRELALDIAKKNLTVDDDWEPIVETIQRKSNFREVPAVKEMLIIWAKSKAYGLLYNNDGYQAWLRKDYESLEKIFDEARRITDVKDAGIKFFDNISLLFEENDGDKLTTGFPSLDLYVNNGGPAKGEVFVWMAPTNKGKSAWLVHTGRVSVEKNLKVLHVTLEMPRKRIMERYMGSFTNEEIVNKIEKRAVIEQKLIKAKESTNGDLIIADFPPEEITTDTIRQLIDVLKRTHNWKPDVVIVDYMELMLSCNSYDNKEDYIRQKRVANQLCNLAKNEDVLVVTATQTNRDGLNGKNGNDGNEHVLNLNKVAESYGKMMAIDYCVTINQTEAEYNEGIARMFIAKNRNGQINRLIRARVNFKTMHFKAEELSI